MIVKLKPFEIPKEITGTVEQKGARVSLVFGLDEVEVGDLSYLCDQFRQSIFKAAKKLDPRPTFNKR